jgi:drug/metabolite transporter (DMT)-like permease
MQSGQVIIFAGLLSVAILKRRPAMYQWLGMLLCVCGIIVVGIASNKSSSSQGESSHKNAVGNVLIVLAMLLSAVSLFFVYLGAVLFVVSCLLVVC